MQFHLLGDIEAATDGGELQLGPPKQRALLAILLLHAGELVPTDRLIDQLWGEEAPRTAAHSIQIYVSELRKLLGPDAIVTRAPGYVLQVPPECIDALEFERLVGVAMQMSASGLAQEAAAGLRSALRLWRGPALADFVYEEFAQSYIGRLHDLHLNAIEELAELELALGRATEALGLVDAALREDPLRERSRELMMLALYRTGRQAEALRTYARYRQQLDEELGIEPSPQLQALHTAVLLRDSALDLAAPVQSSVATPVPPRNPYQGLRPFGEAEAADFHGREALIERLLSAVRNGSRLIALVGPSGSGKSSVLGAGLIPRLRSGAIAGSERWLLVSATPGERALDRLATIPADQNLVLMIDQFEDLFAVVDDAPRRSFIRSLATALERNEGRLVAIISLRADYYDRPLLHRELADLFVAGVINVVPMTPRELEEAITAPARGSGVHVEPALVAELVAELVHQPAALPMLQFALSEMFDQRVGAELTHADYQTLGRLTGLLSRRAEEVYRALEPTAQETARQVFLRLVRLGREGVGSRRRVSIAELVDLEVDPVALSEILEQFGRHRLLTFDRDPIHGQATVEVAHDAFLREWTRLRDWIGRQQAAMIRREALAAAIDEWELADRQADYLPSGTRLAEFQALRAEGGLELTRHEREFLDAGLEHGRAVLQRDAERSAGERRLARTARWRLLAFTGTAILLAVAVGLSAFALPGLRGPRIGLVAPSRGGADDLVEAGFRRAVGDFGFLAIERPIIGNRDEVSELTELSEQDTALIVVFGMDGATATSIARANPATHYLFFEMTGDLVGDAANATYVDFADDEGGYLAGAIAALKTRTGMIGFLGGVEIDVIRSFEAGFRAGAAAVKPGVIVTSTFLTRPPDFSGFVDATAAQTRAAEMYGAGADVIFHAAGIAGAGLFEAAADGSSAVGRQLWVIGVDTDQYATVGDREGAVEADAWRPHILTSIVKRWDSVLYAQLADFEQGQLAPGRRTFGVAAGGFEISYSGGFIDDIRGQIELIRRGIADGSITTGDP